MHPVGPHGLSDPFCRSNVPRSKHTPHFDDFRVLLQTIFWVIWIPTLKMQIKFVDVLVYASGWPSRPVRPIFMVKRASKRAYPSFHRCSCAIANHFLGDPDSDVKNANFFCGRPSRPCLCIQLDITACPAHFEGQTSPEASIPLISTIFVCYCKPFFGWSRLWRQKCQLFLWTSVKTFFMHTVCPHGSSEPFWRSNESRSENTPHFDDFRVLKETIFWVIRIQTSKMLNFFVDARQGLVYASGYPSRPVWPILKVKRASKPAYPSFRRFSCAIENHFSVIQILMSKMPIFLCTYVKTLSMHTVFPHGPSDQFWRSNEPWS